MSGKFWLSVLFVAAAISIPAAVKAFSPDNGKGLACGGNDGPVCALYRVCKPILEKYPESEVAGAGKDCTLTIEDRQLIIRRKSTDRGTGYFFYYRTLQARGTAVAR
ncbi:MAG: hypothetical protein M0011_02570 [Elusimicrobia bacterium]|nr:hypothetical protein [Elusimicrobiota bacterium]